MAERTNDNYLSSQILDALLSEVEPQDSTVDNIPLTEQKRYLEKKVNLLPVDDRLALCKLLLSNGYKSHIKQCAEGVVINLDVLPQNVLNQLYNLILYKHEKLSSQNI
jgi:hypothetical protein